MNRPRILLALIAILVLALVGAFAARWYGAKQRQAALLALAAAGKPVFPEDLVRAPDSGPDPAPWLLRVASAERRFEPGMLRAPESWAQLRENARRGALGPEVEAAFSTLEACAGAADAPTAVARVYAVLEARDGIVDPPPCGLEALELIEAGHAPFLDIAREAAGLGAIDPTVVLKRLEADGATLPKLPAIEIVRLAAALPAHTLRASWSGDDARVLDALRTQADVARVVENSGLLIGAIVWTQAVQRLLDGLEIALPGLDADADLAWLETELERLRPRAVLTAALEGERTWTNRVYTLARTQGQGAVEVPDTGWIPLGFVLAYDQSVYLAAVENEIGRLAKSAYLRPPREEPGWVERRFAPLARMLRPLYAEIETGFDEVEARLALARAALIARRGGAEAALPWIGQSTDPFDGRPLRCAMGREGLVVFWSVGRDRVDQGGGDDALDLIWRLRLR